MKPARLAVLAIALAAGGAAALLMSGEDKPPVQPAAVIVPPPVVPTTDVLVAAAELPMGQNIQAADLRWQAWPNDALSPGYITRPNAPKGLERSSARSRGRASSPANRCVRRSSPGRTAASWPRSCRPACAPWPSPSTRAAPARPAASSCPTTTSTSSAPSATRTARAAAVASPRSPTPCSRTCASWRSARSCRRRTETTSSPARPRPSRSRRARPNSSPSPRSRDSFPVPPKASSTAVAPTTRPSKLVPNRP